MERTLANFTELPAVKQRAVVLRSQGLTHKLIAATLQREFKVSCTKKTIDGWFEQSGMLWQAYMAYNEQLAEEALSESRQLVKTYAREAVTTLRELSQPPHKPKIRVAAAKALATPMIAAIIRDLPIGRNPATNDDIPVEVRDAMERELQIIGAGKRASVAHEAELIDG